MDCRQGGAGRGTGRVVADGIGACAGFSMRCRRSQELRAYPMSKRGWMRFAGRAGSPAKPGSVGQGFVLKGFFVIFGCFPRFRAALMSRFI